MCSGVGSVRCAQRPDGHAPRRMFGFDLLLERQLEAVELHGRQELPVGQLLETLVRAGDAGETFDAVIPGRNIRVANRPVDAVAVLLVGVEIVVAHAVGLPAPGDRTAAEVIAADPGERPIGGRRVRMFAVAHPPLLGRRVEGVTGALDGVVLGALVLRHHAAIRHFPGRGEIQVVGLVIRRGDRARSAASSRRARTAPWRPSLR